MRSFCRSWLLLLGLCASACARSGAEIGVADAASVDGTAAAVDAAIADAGLDAVADASPSDAAMLDAALTDAGLADATAADAMPADASVDAAEPGPPTVSSLSHDLLPRGSSFVIEGTDLALSTSVSIGGVTQTELTALSPSQLRVDALAANTPLGTQSLVVTTSLGSSSAYSVEVIEVDVSLQHWAHGAGATVTIDGFALVDQSTSVAVGGAAQSVMVIDVSTMVVTLGDDAGVGSVGFEWQSSGMSAAPVPVTAMHLVISEVDCDTPSIDTLELIELSTGVAGAALDGYAVVLFSGNDDLSYEAISLQGVTADDQGRVLVGSSNVVPTPSVLFASSSNFVQNGADAVALYQAEASEFPGGTPIRFLGLLDALVYDTDDADDEGLLAGFLGSSSAVQINEDANNDSANDSISRCGATRLDAAGAAFVVTTPSPGAANVCP